MKRLLCIIALKGAITMKQAKNHVGQLPRLFQNSNFVRYIFVVPLSCHVNHGEVMLNGKYIDEFRIKIQKTYFEFSF
jgi:hypothetical protein